MLLSHRLLLDSFLLSCDGDNTPPRSIFYYVSHWKPLCFGIAQFDGPILLLSPVFVFSVFDEPSDNLQLKENANPDLTHQTREDLSPKIEQWKILNAGAFPLLFWQKILCLCHLLLAAAVEQPFDVVGDGRTGAASEVDDAQVVDAASSCVLGAVLEQHARAARTTGFDLG